MAKKMWGKYQNGEKIMIISSISNKKLKKVLFLIKCLGMLGNMVIFAHLFFYCKIVCFCYLFG